MNHSKKSTYLFSIDALRVIAILAVIVIHVTTKTLAVLEHDVAVAPLSLFLNQAARFAVPLFFLISGFVLELNNNTGLSYLIFFKKRASRIIIPFVFWSIIYFLTTNRFEIFTLFSNRFLISLIYGTSSYHLYFIPTLILFYMAFPFLHGVITILKHPFVLTVIIIIQLALLYHDYYQRQIQLSYDLRIAILCFSLFIIGMVASHKKPEIDLYIKKHFLALFIVLISLIVGIYFHVRSLTLAHRTSSYIYNQFSPLNYAYTLVFSGFFSYILEKTQFFRARFIELSKLSFFVFFIHVLVQNILWDTIITRLVMVYGNSIVRSFWFDPLLIALITLLSFGIAYVVHKISWAPKITG